MHLHRSLMAIVLALVLTSLSRGEVPIPNPSFEQGESAADGWTLNQGEGGFVTPGAVGARAIAVTGDGTRDNAWLSEPLPLAPNTVYRLTFQARRVSGTSGLPVSGPLFCNRDLGGLSDTWSTFESYFVSPRELASDQARLRFGQWEVAGQVAFDDVSLQRVIPLYTKQDSLELGEGEMISEGRYVFRAPLSQASANHARPLAWQQCHFNSNRWVLSGPESQVVYRHHVGPAQRSAKVTAEIGWYQSGELLVEVCRDGAEWVALGTVPESGARTFEVPGDLLPCDQLWVRHSARSTAGDHTAPALQLNGYEYEATLAGDAPDLVGATHFLAVHQDVSRLTVNVLGIGDGAAGGRNEVRLQLRNNEDQPTTVRVQVAAAATMATSPHKEPPVGVSRVITLAAGATSPLVILPYELTGTSLHRLIIACTRTTAESGDGEEDQAADLAALLEAPDQTANTLLFAAETNIDVPALHATHYGHTLPGSSPSLALWWCSSAWKVSSRRPAPQAASDALVIRAAANEAEAAQLVLRSERAVNDLTVHASDLVGPAGQLLPAEAIELRRVEYVQVTHPTDETSTVGLWPDPLPPLRGTETLSADRNFPIWVCVHVPKGQAAGTYRGTLELRGSRISVDVPLHIEVFGFELPDQTSCKTAFGLDPSLIWQYHRVNSPEQRRAVLDSYLKCLSDYHISPYNPAPLDSIRVTWRNAPAWSGGQADASMPHAGSHALKVADESTSHSPSAEYLPSVAIPTSGLRLRLRHRSATDGHPFLVTVQHYDAAEQWMSGRNRDLRVESGTNWTEFDENITRFPEGARSVRLLLRPTLWSETGEFTGTVWFDDVSLTDISNGKELIRGGGFEPEEQLTPVPEFDFARWDEAMSRAVDQLHFNTFSLPVPGLGGGTFHARYQPELLGFAEDTPQYQGAMESYLGQLQQHLREKGWLDEAFVYWFDEPDPKDYEFVNNGFAKLKRWAPDIARMLTEQVEPELIGGPNIWCPVSSSYDHASAEKRREAGETFWWYVCTGPKAPYCTLFIDHPGTEMRIWLWQTWQRDITGILVWQSNYWTSPAAYPDPNAPQNPYQDPMGWVSGYSTPAGSRRVWGNGDGRFIYPPEAAADGRPAAPVLDPPVPSLRLAMLRDGLEDYEYLSILRQLVRERDADLTAQQRAEYEGLLNVPSEITSDLTTFTVDPDPIEAHRTALARAIMALQ